MNTMKGLYFLTINLRSRGIYYDYLLTSFHLEVLCNHNMFKDYTEIEDIFIQVLEKSKVDSSLLLLVYSLEIYRLPFARRTKTPELERLVLGMTYNYIAVAKHILEADKVFHNVKPLPFEEGYASTKEMLKKSDINGLVGVLMNIQ